MVLISKGNEVGEPPDIYSVGTWVRITDWESLDNGLLGITITALQRVRIDQPNAQHDGLLTAALQPLPEHVHDDALLEEYSDLTATLNQLEQHPWAEQMGIEIDYADVADISNKLSWLLPVSAIDKQALLETADCREQCRILREYLTRLQQLQQN